MNKPKWHTEADGWWFDRPSPWAAVMDRVVGLTRHEAESFPPLVEARAENERLREALRARDAPADPIEAEQSALEQGLAKLGADTPWMASVLTVLALTDAYMDEWDMVGTKGRAERRETLQKVIPPLLAKAESALIGSAAASLSETGGEGT